MKLYIILILSLISLNSTYSETYESIIMNLYYSSESGNFTTKTSDKRDLDALASAIYNKSYETIGWDYLSISAYEKKIINTMIQ